jgi:hypothetical protein
MLNRVRTRTQTNTKADLALEKGLEKLSTLMDVSLANQREIQNTTKKLGETADMIHKASIDVSKNVAEVTDTSSKLTNTVSTYKEMLLAMPQPQIPGDTVRSKAGATTDPKISRDIERKAKQVLIDVYNKEVTNQSLEEIKNKINKLIAESKEPLEVVMVATIQQIIKMHNRGLILQFQTKEAAEWFCQPQVELTLLPKLDKMALVKERAYQILVLRVPVIFDPSAEVQLRELEERNDLHKSRLCKARWIKPGYRRVLGQQFAHLALTVSTPEDANILIRDGMYICGVKTYPKKLKTEPKQCMKCRKWGHFALECLVERDVCGNCGDDYKTKDCQNKNSRYCASCKNDTQASCNRDCPEFQQRVEQMDDVHPENVLMYFPTEEDWTLHSRPQKVILDDRFPAKYMMASLPPRQAASVKQQ